MYEQHEKRFVFCARCFPSSLCCLWCHFGLSDNDVEMTHRLNVAYVPTYRDNYWLSDCLTRLDSQSLWWTWTSCILLMTNTFLDLIIYLAWSILVVMHNVIRRILNIAGCIRSKRRSVEDDIMDYCLFNKWQSCVVVYILLHYMISNNHLLRRKMNEGEWLLLQN